MFAGVNIMMTIILNISQWFQPTVLYRPCRFYVSGRLRASIVTTMIFGGFSVAPNLRIPVFLLGLLAGGLVAGAVGLLIGIPTLN